MGIEYMIGTLMVENITSSIVTHPMMKSDWCR